jgi:putative aminopeptidase FrvX
MPSEALLPRFEIDSEYLLKTLTDLLNTPSPTGDSAYAISLIEGELAEMGVQTQRTLKGALLAQMEGLSGDRPRAVSAHVDTLGAIVAEIKSSGRLRLHALNGVMWPTVESEGVNVATRSGRLVRGSIVLENGAAHVNKQAHTKERTAHTLEVRLDERTSSAEETRLLGIEVGDFVYFDPRVEVSPSGFVRSRFLDDKACVACALAAVKALQSSGVSPSHPVTLLFSNFEEVGHGGCDGIPDGARELLVLDMACIGEGLSGDEFHCTLCAADAGGPYSRELSERLISIAERRAIDLKIDVYPFYRSDGTAYWHAGGGAQVALVGPGVDTSHGYERTHLDALLDTAALVAEYLVDG